MKLWKLFGELVNKKPSNSSAPSQQHDQQQQDQDPRLQLQLQLQSNHNQLPRSKVETESPGLSRVDSYVTTSSFSSSSSSSSYPTSASFVSLTPSQEIFFETYQSLSKPNSDSKPFSSNATMSQQPPIPPPRQEPNISSHNYYPTPASKVSSSSQILSSSPDDVIMATDGKHPDLDHPFKQLQEQKRHAEQVAATRFMTGYEFPTTSASSDGDGVSIGHVPVVADSHGKQDHKDKVMLASHPTHPAHPTPQKPSAPAPPATTSSSGALSSSASAKFLKKFLQRGDKPPPPPPAPTTPKPTTPPSTQQKRPQLKISTSSTKPPTPKPSPITSFECAKDTTTGKPSIAHIPLPSPTPLPHSISPLDVPNAVSASDYYLSKYSLTSGFGNRYSILGELGSGGFGFVVVAKRLSDNAEVAAKFIVKQKVSTQQWVRDTGLNMIVPMEVYILRNVHHRNICKFLEYFDDEVFGILVMEKHGAPWVSSQNPVRRLTRGQYPIVRLTSGSAGSKAGVDGESTDGDRQAKKQKSQYVPSPLSTDPKPVASSSSLGLQVPNVTNHLASPSVSSLSSTTSTDSSSSSSGVSLSAASSSGTTKPSTTTNSKPSNPGISISPPSPTPSTNGNATINMTAPFPQPKAPLQRLKSFPLPPKILRRPSQDLFEMIEQHDRLPEELARLVFRQIVDAVYYLHRRGIVHRDIKDENVLIDANFRIKLIDFGSATVEPFPDHYFDRFQGTIQYASPEILRGEKYRGRPNDIWSLGILLYTILFGEAPFVNAQSAMTGPYKTPRFKCSAMCLELLDWMLEKHAGRRPTIEQVVKHKWLLTWGEDPR